MKRLLLGIAFLFLVGGLAPGVVAQEPGVAPVPNAQAAEPQQTLEQKIDAVFGAIVEELSSVPFYNLLVPIGLAEPITVIAADGTEQTVIGPRGQPVRLDLPFVVLWLVVAAVLLTFYMRFVNVRLFRHAIDVTRGKYTDPKDQGEVTHFQALTSALSATVGLGNIAGVAIAISLGGPGAMFWMIVAGLLGMTLKFTECTLGQRYRKIDANGRVSGGPMHYLRDGLAKRGLAPLGVVLALLFTVFCIGGSFGGGNSFQVNQSLGIIRERIPWFADNGWVYGLIMVVLTGVVIIGGIKRIARVAEKVVPLMCGVYVLACLTIVIADIHRVPWAFGKLFQGAFNADAIYGGTLGALVMGFRRAAFSNEAGIGSAAIAHSAAKCSRPVREGIVALLEPFIDTVVICTMTAMVILFTDVFEPTGIEGLITQGDHAAMIARGDGAALTSLAFQTVPLLRSWFPWVLMVAVWLFAWSTMISWSYYGERCWTNLFGPRSSLLYKALFLGFVMLGSIVNAQNILNFGDLMILLMAFPNILGLYLLAGEVKRELRDYEADLRAGKFPVYK